MPQKYKKTNASFAKDNASKHEDGVLSKTAVNQIVQAMQASVNKPAKEITEMLQSMTFANANVMNVDAILDSGATASFFRLSITI